MGSSQKDVVRYRAVKELAEIYRLCLIRRKNPNEKLVETVNRSDSAHVRLRTPQLGRIFVLHLSTSTKKVTTWSSQKRGATCAD
jgi:hypothetical protein